MAAFVVTSTTGGSATARLLTTLAVALSAQDLLVVEDGVPDPRSLLERDPAVRVMTVPASTVPDQVPVAATVVGLGSAAAYGWRRWATWLEAGCQMLVLHEGPRDILRAAATREIPLLGWAPASDIAGAARRVAALSSRDTVHLRP